ncbi:MAG: hypothetical protein MJZ37_05355 [Bacilli bacterium]|nr:hypothetical protein [Bacilli bacterium]
MGKQIKITYSNGEEDEFSLNENLDESLLEEALARLEMQAMNDIFGDLKDDQTNEQK